MGKKKILNLNREYGSIVNMLSNKYYAMYMSKFNIDGLDYRQKDFFLRKMWSLGTLAIFKIKNIDEPAVCPYVTATYDMYDSPETVNYVNLRGSPIIPNSTQVVDKDCVIGWANKAHKPVSLIVNWYVERIAQVEMVINTNLQLQKLPFLIPVDSNNQDRLEDIVNKILNNELVIAVNVDDPQLIKALSTNAPYLIDKLTEYKYGLENELKTYLGIDNQGGYLNREQQNLDTTCSNDVEINLNNDSLLSELEQMFDRAHDVLGLNLKISLNHEEAYALQEDSNDNTGIHNVERKD